jgi:hypothetical protein
VRDARSWTYAALFGSLWGAAEASLGAIAKATQLPLSGLPMAALGVVCLVVARRLRPAPGLSGVMGVVAAFLKVFSLGGLIVGPVVAILVEALLVELAMTLGNSSRPAAVLGGALALAASPMQMVLTALLVTGPEAALALDTLARRAASAVGLPSASAAAVMAILMVATAVAGGLLALYACRLAARVGRRLGAAG